MQKEEVKKFKFSNILFGVGRYIFGLVILAIPIILAFIKLDNPADIFILMVGFPFFFIVDPILAIGIYFMLSGKTRIRLDVTLLLIAAILIAVLASTSF